MRNYRAEEALNQLVPIESYRSPLVPTKQFDMPVVLGAVTPARISTEGPVVPTYWFAIDLTADALVAFAHTNVLPPRSGGGVVVAETTPASMHPRDAHAIIRETRESVADQFFTGSAPDPETAARVAAAYASAIPASLQPWLRTCCADFFDWLSPRTGPTR